MFLSRFGRNNGEIDVVLVVNDTLVEEFVRLRWKKCSHAYQGFGLVGDEAEVAETAIVPITGKNVGDNFSQGLEELQ